MSRNRNEHGHPLLISTLGAISCLLLANVRVQSPDGWGDPDPTDAGTPFDDLAIEANGDAPVPHPSRTLELDENDLQLWAALDQQTGHPPAPSRGTGLGLGWMDGLAESLVPPFEGDGGGGAPGVFGPDRAPAARTPDRWGGGDPEFVAEVPVLADRSGGGVLGREIVAPEVEPTVMRAKRPGGEPGSAPARASGDHGGPAASEHDRPPPAAVEAPAYEPPTRGAMAASAAVAPTDAVAAAGASAQATPAPTAVVSGLRVPLGPRSGSAGSDAQRSGAAGSDAAGSDAQRSGAAGSDAPASDAAATAVLDRSGTTAAATEHAEPASVAVPAGGLSGIALAARAIAGAPVVEATPALATAPPADITAAVPDEPRAAGITAREATAVAVGAPAATASAAALAVASASDDAAPAATEHEILEELRARGISDALAQRLLGRARAHQLPFAAAGDLRDAVRAELAQILPQFAGLPETGALVAVVGSGGSGKTRVAATLAAAYRASSALTVRTVAIGGADRVGPLAGLLAEHGIAVAAAEPAGFDRTREADERSGQLVVLDTPAVAPGNPRAIALLRDELGDRRPDAVLVTVPVRTSRTAAAQLLAALAPLRPSALVLTHADETDHFGPAIELSIDSTIPIAYVHRGLDITTALRAADPGALAALLLA